MFAQPFNPLYPQDSVSSYGDYDSTTIVKDQKRDIAELKEDVQVIKSQVTSIHASLRNNPRPSKADPTAKIDSHFQEVVQIILGRIEVFTDSNSANFARPILQALMRKSGELSKDDRLKLARVIGRFEIAPGIDNTTPQSQTLHLLLPTIPMSSHQYTLQRALGRLDTIGDSDLVGIQDALEGLAKKEIFDEASKGILVRVIGVLDALELRWDGTWEGKVCETTRMDLERLL
ncbi:hypothetical protein B9479_007800 [Cryptococcus floricola]|uniref:Uncharacterized protein n=1 Tax=Cryptococcus floricola TaxID=2591691 RepID=A0A5D3AKX9_9TREE|nr:hypothetical protein B9479_007800 [Cryptococcus floricola]